MTVTLIRTSVLFDAIFRRAGVDDSDRRSRFAGLYRDRLIGSRRTWLICLGLVNVRTRRLRKKRDAGDNAEQRWSAYR